MKEITDLLENARKQAKTAVNISMVYTYFENGRQVRFTFNEEHFRVDLVFFNRILRCFVLFDLKIGQLKHQDIGQMQMYVNYYDRVVKLPEENPTIGMHCSLQRQK